MKVRITVEFEMDNRQDQLFGIQDEDIKTEKEMLDSLIVTDSDIYDTVDIGPNFDDDCLYIVPNTVIIKSKEIIE